MSVNVGGAATPLLRCVCGPVRVAPITPPIVQCEGIQGIYACGGGLTGCVIACIVILDDGRLPRKMNQNLDGLVCVGGRSAMLGEIVWLVHSTYGAIWKLCI